MKIKSVRYLGRQKTYSPEMRGEQHNYITAQSNTVHLNSHSVSYILVAHRCLYLKAHFAPEYWAAVMSDCHPGKLSRYMGIARSEKWKPTAITKTGNFKSNDNMVFDIINIEDLTTNYTVTGNAINQGLIGIKGIGESMAQKFAGRGKYSDIDDFMEKKSGDKIVLERFIKLGAFNHLHPNSYALWMWYQYKYTTGAEITKLRKEVRERLLEKEGWNFETIEAEIKRQIMEYKKLYPKRNKLPSKITNWKPKPNDTRDNVMSLFEDRSYSLSEVLEFEKQYLGYYLHSPLDLYDVVGDCTIEDAKRVASQGGEPRLEVIVVDIEFAMTKTNKQYARLSVSDGITSALVLIFGNELIRQDENNLVPGAGVQLSVDYDETRGTFTLCRNETILKLLPKGWRTR